MTIEAQLVPRGKHGCIGTTKTGKPCDGNPMKGREVCVAHVDDKTKESLRFGGAQPGAGRPRLPKPMDLARQMVEAHAVALLRPDFKALGFFLHDDGSVTELSSGAVVVYQGEATEIEDLGAQSAAAHRLFDRVYGKPRQQTELTGADGGPVEVVVEARARAEAMSREELDAFLLGVDAADAVRDDEELDS
jgi:hypothetical protein